MGFGGHGELPLERPASVPPPAAAPAPVAHVHGGGAPRRTLPRLRLEGARVAPRPDAEPPRDAGASPAQRAAGAADLFSGAEPAAAPPLLRATSASSSASGRSGSSSRGEARARARVSGAVPVSGAVAMGVASAAAAAAEGGADDARGAAPRAVAAAASVDSDVGGSGGERGAGEAGGGSGERGALARCDVLWTRGPLIGEGAFAMVYLGFDQVC